MAKPGASRAVLLSIIIIFVTVLIIAYLLDGGAAITMTALRLRGGIAIFLWLTSTYLQCPHHGRYGSGSSSRALFVLLVVINLGGTITLLLMLRILEGKDLHGWHEVKQEVDGMEDSRVVLL